MSRNPSSKQIGPHRDEKSRRHGRPPGSGGLLPVFDPYWIVFCLAETGLSVSLQIRTGVRFMLVFKSNPVDPKMKIVFMAAAAALLAASCSPNAAPAPGKPVYVAPTK
jgi:hypothetical protein